MSQYESAPPRRSMVKFNPIAVNIYPPSRTKATAGSCTSGSAPAGHRNSRHGKCKSKKCTKCGRKVASFFASSELSDVPIGEQALSKMMLRELKPLTHFSASPAGTAARVPSDSIAPPIYVPEGQEWLAAMIDSDDPAANYVADCYQDYLESGKLPIKQKGLYKGRHFNDLGKLRIQACLWNISFINPDKKLRSLAVKNMIKLVKKTVKEEIEWDGLDAKVSVVVRELCGRVDKDVQDDICWPALKYGEKKLRQLAKNKNKSNMDEEAACEETGEEGHE